MGEEFKKIAEKLKSENIEMRPKWHFWLRSLLLAVSIFLIFALTLFLTSFAFFCHARPGLFLGWPYFSAVLLAIAFILVAEALLSKYAFSYRKPVIYTLVAIVLFVFIFGFFISKSDFHSRIERRNIPFIRKIYKMPPEINFAPECIRECKGRQIKMY